MDPAKSSSEQDEVPHSERFFRYFQHEITALQDQMSRLTDTALIGGERVDATDHCLAGIARLASEVRDASTYLPSYDQRTYAEAIKALQEKLAETRTAFAPKQRFTFKTSRKNPSAVSLNDAAELAAQKRRQLPGHHLSPDVSSVDTSLSTTPQHLRSPPNEVVHPDAQPVPGTTLALDRDQKANSPKTSRGPEDLDSPANTETTGADGRPQLSTTATSVSISNQNSAHIILPRASSHAISPCSLTRLNRCIVDMTVPTSNGAPFAGLTVRNIQSSLLLCGMIDGPVHITNVSDSVLVAKCRQFRMHECRNVDVYFTCSSRPIIEDCSQIRFAKMPETYAHMNQEDHPTRDQWDQIDDFKWHKAEPSPNWSILPPEDAVVEEVWRDVVPGGPGWSLDDILKATKVIR